MLERNALRYNRAEMRLDGGLLRDATAFVRQSEINEAAFHVQHAEHAIGIHQIMTG